MQDYRDKYTPVMDYLQTHSNELFKDFLGMDNQNKGYICPFCGNGKGESGDGIRENLHSQKRGYYKCFSCGYYGSSIDFLAEKFGLSNLDFKEELIGITKNIGVYDQFKNLFEDKAKIATFSKSEKKNLFTDLENKTQEPQTFENRSKKVQEVLEAVISKKGKYKEFIKRAHKDITKPAAQLYLKDRGFKDLEKNTVERFQFGYVHNYKEPYKKIGKDRIFTIPIEEGIVIPESYFGYGIRNIKPKGKEPKYIKPSSELGAIEAPTGLKQVLEDPNRRDPITGYLEPIFIVEGFFDAPSFWEADRADAIALNGFGNVEYVLEAFKKFHIKRPVILALDNDKEGQKNTSRIRTMFEEKDIKTYEAQNLYSDYKDANEFLTKNREGFKQALKANKEIPFKDFDSTFNKAKQQKLKESLQKKAESPGIKTGFNLLDDTFYLDGGLREGLYILGAVSSLGKTTFILQLADQIASKGQDVIFFSLEMSETELMTKSISRYTYTGNRGTPKSLMDIYRNNTIRDDDGSINQAIEDYFKATGDHLRIIESTGNVDSEYVRKAVQEHIEQTGRAPVVFIDYLQILSTPKDSETGRRLKMTDKQKTDANIYRLKQISREFKIPILGVSSFNRDNYNEHVSMKSFKESGAIEYSSDVLIGLEPAYMLDPESNKDLEEKKIEQQTDIRKVALTILKNRNGYANNSIIYNYQKKYNHFEEVMTGKDYLNSQKKKNNYSENLIID